MLANANDRMLESHDKILENDPFHDAQKRKAEKNLKIRFQFNILPFVNKKIKCVCVCVVCTSCRTGRNMMHLVLYILSLMFLWDVHAEISNSQLGIRINK